MSKKGPAWEREFAVDLSKWWTGGESDQEFWRTSGSGARATTRGKKGLKTKAHNGDILSVDEVGKPFTDYFCIETKRGYQKDTIQDLLDCASNAKTQVYQEWINKAKKCCDNSGSVSWMIVFRRNRREPIVMMEDLEWIPKTSKSMTFHCFERCSPTIRLMSLREWFRLVKPEMIKFRLSIDRKSIGK